MNEVSSCRAVLKQHLHGVKRLIQPTSVAIRSESWWSRRRLANPSFPFRDGIPGVSVPISLHLVIATLVVPLQGRSSRHEAEGHHAAPNIGGHPSGPSDYEGDNRQLPK